MAVNQHHFNRAGFTRSNINTYIGLNGLGNSHTSEVNGTHPWSVAGTFKNLKVRQDTALLTGRSSTLVLRVNGVDSALSVAVSEPALAGFDSVNTVHVDPGDDISFHRIYGGTLAAGTDELSFTVEFESDNPRESGHGSHHAGQSGNSTTTSYNKLFAQGSLWSLLPVDPDIVAVAGVLDRYDVDLTGSPGSGNSFVFSIILNGIEQDGSGGTVDTRQTIADLATGGSWTGSLTLSPGDLVYMKRVGVGTPTARASAIGVRFVADVDGYSNLVMQASGTGNNVYAGAPDLGFNATESLVEQIAPISNCYLTGMRVALNGILGDPGDSLTLDVRVSQVTPANAPSVTIADAATGGVDSSGNAAELTNADTWAIRSTTIGTPHTRIVSIAFGQTASISPPNDPPAVDAGADDEASDLAYTLQGSVTDPDSSPTIAWSQISGPVGGTATFADATSPTSGVTFSKAGEYVLQLSADDGVNPAVTDTVTLTVHGLAYLWEKVSGPGTVTFGDATLRCTTATFSEDGVYVLRLTADDGELSSSDTMTVTVNPTPGYVVLINEVITEFLVETLNARAAANARDTLSVQIYRDDIGLAVPRNAEVVVELDGERVFGGVLNFPRHRGFGNIGWVHINEEINATDFNAYADRRVVDTIIPSGATLSSVAIVDSTVGNPATVATQIAHGLTTGDRVVISGHSVYNFPGTKAYAFLKATANFVDGETVTLGTQTYTFEAVFSDTADHVLIGGDNTASLNNLIAAINADAGSGTVYGTGTTANADADASLFSSDSMKARALNVGTAGNSIACTHTCANADWVGEGLVPTTTLKLGEDPVAGGGGASVINGEWIVTVLDTTSFTIPVNNTVYGVGGSVTRTYLMVDVLTGLNTTYLAERGITIHPDQVDGPAVPPVSPTFQTVAQALDSLAISAGNWIWTIDYFKRLRMWEPGEVAAPFDIVDDDGHVIGDMTIEYEEEYANSVFVLAGGSGPGEIVTDSVVADGVYHGGVFGYTFQYPAHDNYQDTWPSAVVFDGVTMGPADWGPLPVLPSGSYGWWWDPYTQTLWHDEDNDVNPATILPPAGTVITAMYRSKYPLVVHRKNQTEIDSSGAGQVDKVVTYPDVKTLPQAIILAEEDLASSVDQPRTIHYTTETPGLAPGQVQHVTSPIRAIDADFLIVEVNTVNDESNAIRYKITAVEGTRFRGTWRDVFKSWK